MIERRLAGVPAPQAHRPNLRLTNVGTPEVSARVYRRLNPAPRIVGPLLTSGAGTPMITAESRRASFRAVPDLTPALDNFVLHGLEYGQLGFSLKPPRWLRKAQPGVFLRRNAKPILIGAGALATLAIPGVAPFVGSAILGAGKAVVKGAGGLFKMFKPAPTLPQNALAQALAMGTGSNAVPIATPATVATFPAPSTEIPGVAMGTSVLSPSDSGDGGSALTSSSGAEAPLIGPPEPPKQAGFGGTGIAVLAGLALLMLMKKPRRA